MSFSDIVSIFNLAEPVRLAIPWQWRPYFSDWLIWTIFFVFAAGACMILHFVLAQKHNIDWSFETSARIVGLTASGADPARIVSVELDGINVSSHDLHQIDGKIVLQRTARELPLYAVVAGQWVPVIEVDTVPPGARLIVGGPLNSENYWTEFPHQPNMEDFLRDFGGFDLTITVDGQKYAWSFSIDELRDRIGRAIRKMDDDRTKMLGPPQVTKKPAVAK